MSTKKTTTTAAAKANGLLDSKHNETAKLDSVWLVYMISATTGDVNLCDRDESIFRSEEDAKKYIASEKLRIATELINEMGHDVDLGESSVHDYFETNENGHYRPIALARQHPQDALDSVEAVSELENRPTTWVCHPLALPEGYRKEGDPLFLSGVVADSESDYIGSDNEFIQDRQIQCAGKLSRTRYRLTSDKKEGEKWILERMAAHLASDFHIKFIQEYVFEDEKKQAEVVTFRTESAKLFKNKQFIDRSKLAIEIQFRARFLAAYGYSFTGVGPEEIKISDAPTDDNSDSDDDNATADSDTEPEKKKDDAEVKPSASSPESPVVVDDDDDDDTAKLLAEAQKAKADMKESSESKKTKKDAKAASKSKSTKAKAKEEKKEAKVSPSESKKAATVVVATAAATAAAPTSTLQDWHTCHNLGLYLANSSAKVTLNDGTELTVYTTTKTSLMLYMTTKELEEKIPMPADSFLEEERTPVSCVMSIMLVVDSKWYHAVSINELISLIDAWPKAVAVPKEIIEKYRSLRAALTELRNKVTKDHLYSIKLRDCTYKGALPSAADKRKPKAAKSTKDVKEVKEKAKESKASTPTAETETKKRKAPSKPTKTEEPPAKKQKTVTAASEPASKPSKPEKAEKKQKTAPVIPVVAAAPTAAAAKDDDTEGSICTDVD